MTSSSRVVSSAIAARDGTGGWLSAGQAARIRSPASARLIGRTRVSAATAMKLASPVQRGTQCTWRWSDCEPPAAAPRFTPDVHGVAGERRLERDHRVAHPRPELGVLLGGEVLELGHGPPRQHHQVPGGVRVEVEQREAVLAPPQHAGRLVALLVGPGQDPLEQRSPVGLLRRRQRPRVDDLARRRPTATWPTGAQAARIRCPHGRLARAQDLGVEALGEGVDVDVALGLIAAAGVDADGAGLHVAVADDEDVRELLELGLADARAERLLGLAERRPGTRRPAGGRRRGRRRRGGRCAPGAPAPARAPARPGTRRRSARRARRRTARSTRTGRGGS